MKKCLPVLITSLLFPSTLASASQSPIDIDAAFNTEQTTQQNNEKQYQDFAFAYMAEYETWRTEYLKEFDQFQAEVIAKWGVGEVSKKQKNVQYSDDKTVKSTIDYANNEITVAVLVDSNDSDSEARKKVILEIKNLTKDQNNTLAQFIVDDAPIKDTDQAITIKPITFSTDNEKKTKRVIIEQTKAQLREIDKEADKEQLNGKDDLSIDIAEKVIVEKKKKLLSQAKKRITKLHNNFENKRKDKKSQLTQKKVVEYKIPLPKSGLSKRANSILPSVKKEGLKWKVSPAILMAVIHSESSFDPMATSPIPAYGLMQIVPTTAGHDVNQLVRKINSPMSSNDLYVPNINIETGAAYLNILNTRYLKAIKNDESRLYCMIAAYNTGAGNVAKAFNKDRTRNIRKAADVINAMEPDQVYQHLLESLPYDETKLYLKKVYGRIAQYEKIVPKTLI